MRDTGFEPARGRIFRAREAPIGPSCSQLSARRNFPSARGTNKSFPRRGRQPEEVTGSHPRAHKKSPDLASEDSILVRDTGFEPVTSSV